MNSIDEVPEELSRVLSRPIDGKRERNVTVDDAKKLVTLPPPQPDGDRGRSTVISTPSLPQRDDLLRCRYQTTLVERLTQKIKPGGWLYIGHSESLIGSHPGLRLIGRTIYRRESVSVATAVRQPADTGIDNGASGVATRQVSTIPRKCNVDGEGLSGRILRHRENR